ncbi:E3 ubiquitin-protein ligase TRIM39-like isoform X2 [Aquarana catesbeiana]
MASADLRKELECSICLEIYTDPVTLKCGHNFCRDCIVRMLDTQEGSGGYPCPECREEFQDRSALRRNTTLRNIVENFLSAQADQKSGFFCTYCIHTPVPAVISCLMCEASLCDNHLRVHSKSPEHVLCELTTSLENRKCSVHKELLEYYCTEDSTCICAYCRLALEHQGHQVETLDVAFEMKKKKLRNVLQISMIEREETEKRVQSLQERRKTVQGKADDETERATALFRDLRRRLEELEKRVLSEISGQAERISLSLSDMIQQLEIKKEELSRKMVDIEKLCNMTDPLTFLQESDMGDLCDVRDNENERYDKLLHDGGDLDVAGISLTLHKGLSDLISGVNIQKCTGTEVYSHSTTKKISPYIAKQPRKRPQPTPAIQHSHRQAGGPNIASVQQKSEFADILLDAQTAGNHLQISGDRKTVSRTAYEMFSETPGRFRSSQVLSSQRFSSGRLYWEVDLGVSQMWRVGMCYPSIARIGYHSQIGYNEKSWCLEARKGNRYSVVHDSNTVPLPGYLFSRRVRIELDYEAGQISFYDLCDPIRHLYTFTTTFTEPLHAVLRVGSGSSIKISGGKSDVRKLPRYWEGAVGKNHYYY